MSKNVLIVEVPTEAGTHWPGQCKAPAALQNAGLQSRLQQDGFNVQTISALSEGPQLWQPHRRSAAGVRGEEEVLKCMEAVTSILSYALSEASTAKDASGPFGTFPIIIGGPCSISPAVTCAMNAQLGARDHGRLGLLWVDNDADLTLPEETSAPGATAILDSMTMSHLTQRSGGLESMKKYSSPNGSPLVNPDNVVLFGLDVTQPAPSHFAFLLDHHYRAFTNHAVKQDSVAAMQSALRFLDDRCGHILLHFDVDVIDSAQWPLGNYPSYGGLGFETVMKAVKVALGHRKVIGLVLTEINPNNDPDKRMVSELVAGLVEGLKGRSM